MTLGEDELISLIEMHGATIVDACECPGCHLPIKDEMLRKVDRMRELIKLLPDHDESADVFEPEARSVQ